MMKHRKFLSAIVALLLILTSSVIISCSARFGEPEYTNTTDEESSENIIDYTSEPVVEPIPGEAWSAEGASAFLFDSRLSPQASESIDETKVGTNKTIEIAGKELKIFYTKTLHFDNGNRDLDEYGIAGYSDRSSVRLFPDGTVSTFMVYSDDEAFVKLEANWDESEETIRTTLEDLFANETDFARYNEFGAEEIMPGSYELTWQRTVNGIKTDESFGLSISHDRVNHLMKQLPGFNWDGLPEGFSFDDYIPLAEQALREEYGDAFVRCHIMNFWLTDIEGLPSFYCRASVEFIGEGGTAVSEARGVVIQLQPNEALNK